MTEFIWRSKPLRIEICILASNLDEAREYAKTLLFSGESNDLIAKDPIETRAARPQLLYYGGIRR
jgi:hypothetical protein